MKAADRLPILRRPAMCERERGRGRLREVDEGVCLGLRESDGDGGGGGGALGDWVTDWVGDWVTGCLERL